jgi:cyclophilin family peptidyl-prolyl cis-trans isomerase
LRFATALALAGACATAPAADHAAPSAMPSAAQTILELEDARSDGGGLLEALLGQGREATRERAAVALGRLGYPEHDAEVTLALCNALGDPSARVRRAAAFALGERGDPAAASALLEHRDDADVVTRARIVEAASRVPDKRMRDLVVQALGDARPEVRREAALGPHRWPVDRAKPADPDDARIDEALIEVVNGTAKELAQGGSPQDEHVAASAVFSLARRKCDAARAAFILCASRTNDVEATLFAIQGLGNIAAETTTNAALRNLLGARDWRVVCEAAIALAKHPECESIERLSELLDHKSAHVRRCAAEALGSFAACKAAARAPLGRAALDLSANVRAAALEAEAKLYGDETVVELERLASDRDAVVRAGVASAAGHLSSKLAVPLLVRLSKDPSLRVADVATHALEAHVTDDARARLRELLTGSDNGLRLAAVEALRKQRNPDDLPLLARCYETAHGEISSELSFGVLESAAEISGNGALELLERGLTHADPYVRKRARDLIARKFPSAAVPDAPAPPGPDTSTRSTARVPVLGRDLAYPRGNPLVEIRTSRGAMVFELFADETPVHVYSFLELVLKHHYDNLSFHRVVPDFVIQGGDVRGDGNGGASWRGDALRSELTPRKFGRGALGMPRNDDPDSGGSQIFVTHRWTPHLDGRYTLFGELRRGEDVLDAIEVGDTILGIDLVPVADAR